MSTTILITGSLNANPADRFLPRSRLRPVQILMADGWRHLKKFDHDGELGISSFACCTDSKTIFYTCGRRIFTLKDGIKQALSISGLEDVHEMEVNAGVLCIANTRKDEAIFLDTQSYKVIERKTLPLPKSPDQAPKSHETTGRYHCNQIFFDRSGVVCCLVHHAFGKQKLEQLAQKTIKKHGDGGVVYLESGKVRNLKLKAPHNVRIMDDGYLVLDSGRGRAVFYDEYWKELSSFGTAGWGRGCDSIGREVWIGNSARRKRYFTVENNNVFGEKNQLQVFDKSEGAITKHFSVEGVEQINNVYCAGGALPDWALEELL